jgi:hypothetical protein
VSIDCEGRMHTLIIYARVEDFNKAKDLATSAAKSGAYLYPLKVSNTNPSIYARYGVDVNRGYTIS